MQSRLPDPCEECIQYGGNFRINERGSAERCSCARGQALLTMQKLRDQPKDPITFRPSRMAIKVASQAARTLKHMPGLTWDEDALTMVADEIARLAKSRNEAVWLVRRMQRLYRRWPGTLEMRIMFCSRFLPADGDVPTEVSEFYPDGIPSELEQPQAVPGALPPGHSVSADPEWDQAVTQLAEQKRLKVPAKLAKRGMIGSSTVLTGTEGK